MYKVWLFWQNNYHNKMNLLIQNKYKIIYKMLILKKIPRLLNLIKMEFSIIIYNN